MSDLEAMILSVIGHANTISCKYPEQLQESIRCDLIGIGANVVGWVFGTEATAKQLRSTIIDLNEFAEKEKAQPSAYMN